MLKFLKNASIAYISFGVGVILGSIIASTIAGILIRNTLSVEQLEIMNEVADDFTEE